MCGARRMAPLFEQCASASGATARTSSTAATKQSCCCSVKSRSARVGVGEVREHARDLDVGGVLGERAEQLGQPVGTDPEPPHPRVDLHVHARPTTDACRRARDGVDALVVVHRGLDALGDERVVAAGIAPADDQHGHAERRRRRTPRSTTRRRARWHRPRSRPRRRAGCRARSRSTSPSPSRARRRPRAGPAPTCWRGSPTTSTSTRLRGVNALELDKRANQSERRLLGRLAERVVDDERDARSRRRHRRWWRTPRPRGRWRR